MRSKTRPLSRSIKTALEAVLLRRREVLRLLLALALQRLGARRRFLSVDLGNGDQYRCRDQQRRAPVPHAAAGSASAVNRRFSRARLAASASHTRTITRFTSAKPRTEMRQPLNEDEGEDTGQHVAGAPEEGFDSLERLVLRLS